MLFAKIHDGIVCSTTMNVELGEDREVFSFVNLFVNSLLLYRLSIFIKVMSPFLKSFSGFIDCLEIIDIPVEDKSLPRSKIIKKVADSHNLFKLFIW